MLYRADIVIAGRGEVIPAGAVRIAGNRILAVGSASELPPLPGEPVVDLPGQVLSPGFINSHCHLDYSRMKGLIPRASFTKWIASINSHKRCFSDDDFIEAIHHGFELLITSGTTTVGNIESFPELLPRLPAPPIRTWWFLELNDLRIRPDTEERTMGVLSFFHNRPGWLGGFGLSPHAPYSASLDLYRLARHCSERYHMPFTTHIAESREENEMFLYGSGPLHDMMAKLGRDNSDCGHGSSLSHLVEHEVLTQDCLAVHLNYMQEYDWECLKRSGASVVHCPKSHAYFGYAEFQMERMRREGINVCLGTDSLASNTSLDLRAEARLVLARHGVALRDPSDPQELARIEWNGGEVQGTLTPADIWRMMTVHPAKALGQAGRLGELIPGALADIVAFPLRPQSGNDPFLSLIEGTSAPTCFVIDGRRIISEDR